ncbi:hypothetical protein D0T49_06180 [Paludibacter sp. 221]|nr:hypothetical protein [Paludibacter sp. 221]
MQMTRVKTLPCEVENNDRLYLKVNRGKTQVGYVRRMKFLGYSFYMNKGECRQESEGVGAY